MPNRFACDVSWPYAGAVRRFLEDERSRSRAFTYTAERRGLACTRFVIKADSWADTYPLRCALEGVGTIERPLSEGAA